MINLINNPSKRAEIHFPINANDYLINNLSKRDFIHFPINAINYLFNNLTIYQTVLELIFL